MKLSLVSGSVYNASLCKNDCYYSMAEKKYWKISLGVMVIPRESIEFSHSGLRPSWVNSILSLGITITPRDIFQYFFSAIEYLLNNQLPSKVWSEKNSIEQFGVHNVSRKLENSTLDGAKEACKKV